MADLPARPDLDQLRHHAKDLLHAAQRGNPAAVVQTSRHRRHRRALIASGAPVDGHPGDKETPLITGASSGAADVARVLIEAGPTSKRSPHPTPAVCPAAPRSAMRRCSG